MERRLIDANAYRQEWMKMRTFEPMKVLDMQETVLSIPENPTNGDMIVSLYPNLRYVIQNGRVVTTIGVATSFDLDWWNAPWEGGKT